MQGRRQLPIRVAACALRPLPPRSRRTDASAPTRLAFDLVVQVDVRAAAFVPNWLFDWVMRMVVPWLCRRVLALVHHNATAPDSEFRRRMNVDRTGVYAKIRGVS